MMPIPRISIWWRVTLLRTFDIVIFVFFYFDDIIGDQAMAALYKSKGGFTFPDGGIPLDENTDAKDFDQCAMAAHAWSKFFNQQQRQACLQIHCTHVARKSGISNAFHIAGRALLGVDSAERQ